MIPNFNDLGILPAGAHPCSLDDVRATFATNERREQLFGSLLQCLELMRARGLQGTLYLDGSYATDKALPGDMEVTLDVRASPRDIQDHALVFYCREFAALKATGIDWYPTLPDNNDFTLFFQYAGEKTAAAKRCDPKEPKGILRLTQW